MLFFWCKDHIFLFRFVLLCNVIIKTVLMKDDISIRQAKIYKASSVLKKPISDATHTLTEISFLVLRLQLENGVVGESYLLSFQYSPNAIVGALKDVIPVIKGFKANETGLVYEK